jgi:aminopeptidase YwaD
MGYIKGNTAYSLYNTKKKVKELSIKIFDKKYGIVEGPKWFQGEHAILSQIGISSIAFTSELLDEIMKKVHTKDDRLDIINYKQVVNTALALSEFIININREELNE